MQWYSDPNPNFWVKRWIIGTGRVNSGGLSVKHGMPMHSLDNVLFTNSQAFLKAYFIFLFFYVSFLFFKVQWVISIVVLEAGVGVDNQI